MLSYAYVSVVQDVLVPHHYDDPTTLLPDDQQPQNDQAASRVSTMEKADQYGESNIQIVSMTKTADPLVSSCWFVSTYAGLSSDCLETVNICA